MIKNITYIFIVLLLITGCKTDKPSDTQVKIDRDLLLENIKTLSSDAFEGRSFGSQGNYRAQQHIAKQFEQLGIEPALDSGYVQEFSQTLEGKYRLRAFPIDSASLDISNIPDTTVTGGNVLAKIAGQTDKVIVVSGHLDHLGKRNDKIFNGADDNASGTAALFAIAKYFKEKSLQHTLVFAALDAEEIGSPGCTYLVENFPGGLDKVALNVNMDMISHNDSLEIYAVGLYHYPELKKPLEAIKSPITILYGHDDPNNKDLDDWTNSSDHKIFHYRKIPFVYFGVEDHRDYHAPTDTFENINQDFYVEAVKLIIQAIERYDTALSE